MYKTLALPHLSHTVSYYMQRLFPVITVWIFASFFPPDNCLSILMCRRIAEERRKCSVTCEPVWMTVLEKRYEKHHPTCNDMCWYCNAQSHVEKGLGLTSTAVKRKLISWPKWMSALAKFKRDLHRFSAQLKHIELEVYRLLMHLAVSSGNDILCNMAFWHNSLYLSSNYFSDSHPPTLSRQTTLLDQAPYRSTRVGSKAITIMKHYHSSSSINTGNNDNSPAPEIIALPDVWPISNN